MGRAPPGPTLFPYTTLFRSSRAPAPQDAAVCEAEPQPLAGGAGEPVVGKLRERRAMRPDLLRVGGEAAAGEQYRTVHGLGRAAPRPCERAGHRTRLVAQELLHRVHRPHGHARVLVGDLVQRLDETRPSELERRMQTGDGVPLGRVTGELQSLPDPVCQPFDQPHALDGERAGDLDLDVMTRGREDVALERLRRILDTGDALEPRPAGGDALRLPPRATPGIARALEHDRTLSAVGRHDRGDQAADAGADDHQSRRVTAWFGRHRRALPRSRLASQGGGPGYFEIPS